MPRLDGEQFNDYVWVDGEPVSRQEIHQAAGFTKRDPEYLLEKRKQSKIQIPYTPVETDKGYTPKHKEALKRWKQNKIDKEIRETHERLESYKKLREENQ